MLLSGFARSASNFAKSRAYGCVSDPCRFAPIGVLSGKKISPLRCSVERGQGSINIVHNLCLGSAGAGHRRQTHHRAH